MLHFSFFSKDPFHVVLQQLEELHLGKLVDVCMYERSQDYQYVAYYEYFTSIPMIESMKYHTEFKLVYEENEHGYPLYWKIWW
jgi:hypothetical protein